MKKVIRKKKERIERENADSLKSALIKKALGYDSTETVEEYVGSDEGEIRLAKKKVTVKEVPPDMTAIKILLETELKSVSQMTDAQLESEKERLLKILAQKNEGDENNEE